MSTLHTLLARHRAGRDRVRAGRELRRLQAAAPTQETAHEIAAIGTRL
jgi:hypothetical protein